MLFTESTLNIHTVYAFSTRMTCLFENPTPPAKDGVVVLIDASRSMEEFQDIMRMVVSVLKCMSKTQGMWNLPEPRGGTALVDSVDSIMADKKLGVGRLQNVTKIIVVTDGDDTRSKAQKLVKSFLANGEPEMIETPQRPFDFKTWLVLPGGGVEGEGTVEEYKDYAGLQWAKRRDAIATHLDKIGVEAAVIGVGTEVKHFIASCGKAGKGLRTGYIEPDTSSETIGAIVTTVGERLKRPRSENVGVTVTASNATPLSEHETIAIGVEARRTSTHSDRRINTRLIKGGSNFDKETETRYVQFIVASVANAPPKIDEDVLMTIVVWFRDVALSKPSVAVDLICGRLYPKDKHGRRNGAVFEPPNDKLTASQWTSALKKLIELLSRDPERITDRVPGLADAFRDEIADNAVGPLFFENDERNSYMALTFKDLPQITGRALYYKFTTTEKYTSVHVSVNHRASALEWGGMTLPSLAALQVVWRGNSGWKSYGGSRIDPAELGVADQAVETTAEASDADDGSSSGTTDDVEVLILKRKIATLEAEKTELASQLKRAKEALGA